MKPLIALVALAVLTAGPAFALGKEAAAGKPDVAPLTQAEDDAATAANKKIAAATVRIKLAGFYCSGVLVDKNVVLTSADCLERAKENLVDVRFEGAPPRKILACAEKGCADQFVGDKKDGLALLAFEGPALQNNPPAAVAGGADAARAGLVVACRDGKGVQTSLEKPAKISGKTASIGAAPGLARCGAGANGGPAFKLAADGSVAAAGVVVRPATVGLIAEQADLKAAIERLQRAAEKKSACNGGSTWGCK